MQTKNLIGVNEFCINHSMEVSFISTLQQNGLIEVKIIENAGFIELDQLKQLEQIVHFYFELDINLEGIETINHMLQRINTMQNEITMLRNRLRFYEEQPDF
jgi:hypothetical protein